MDWLLEIEEPLAEAVYWSVADLLDLEVDLLFFDTTSTYFESSGDDREVNGEKVVGFRTFGHSKDSRPDLPQVVIGMAVTRTGIPIGSGPGLVGGKLRVDQGELRDGAERVPRHGTRPARDRAHALIDPDTGKVASAKQPRKWARLFEFRSAMSSRPGTEIRRRSA